MARQAQEIQAVNTAYEANITRLLDALEALQLEYLKEAENRIRTKYLWLGKIGEKPGPNADESLLVIRAKTESKIDAYFANKRAEVRRNFEKKREEFLKLKTNIDNIAQINAAVSEYIDSPIRLRRAQDEFGRTLLSKLEKLGVTIPVNGAVIDQVIRLTDEEVNRFLGENPKTL